MDLNSVLIAGQIEEGIAKMLGYINEGCSLSRGRLEEEDHCSKDLGERLALTGSNKPYPRCHAHAIVSGGHGRADTLRAILAKFKIKIDDPDNGCWLPENTEAKKTMTGQMAKTVPHSRIHRYNYYIWMDTYIKMSATKDEKHLRFQLSMIENALINSTFPPYVMQPANKEYTP